MVYQNLYRIFIVLMHTFYKCVYSKYCYISFDKAFNVIFILSRQHIFGSYTSKSQGTSDCTVSLCRFSRIDRVQYKPFFFFLDQFEKMHLLPLVILMVLLDNRLPFDLCYYFLTIFCCDSFSKGQPLLSIYSSIMVVKRAQFLSQLSNNFDCLLCDINNPTTQSG